MQGGMSLLLRILLGLAVLWVLWRTARRLGLKAGRRSGPRRLTSGEIIEFGLLAKNTPALAEALTLRAKIVELALGSGWKSVAIQADEAIRQLGAQAETRQRIENAVEDLESGRLRRQLDASRQVAAGAATDDERRAAEARSERLDIQIERLQRLSERWGELDRASQEIVLELRDVHLALLDAASSKADLGSDTARQMRSRLELITDEMRRSAHSDEDVARILRDPKGVDPKEDS